MRHFIFPFVFLICLVSCRTVKTVPVESRTDSVYVERLVPYPIEADSATVRALMECDEAGRVIMKSLEASHSKRVTLEFAVDSLGELLAAMRVRRDTVLLPAAKTYVTRYVEKPVMVERELTRWEKIKIEAGGWAIGALSGGIILAVIALVLWLRGRMK